MTDYTKSTNFTSKDSLATGNPLKIIKGAEFDTEFNNIVTAVATKANSASPTLTGTPLAPTATAGTNTTQLATTAFVTGAVATSDAAVRPVTTGGTGAATLALNNVVLGNGTSAVQVVAPGTTGNLLTSNGTTWQSTTPATSVTSLNGQTGAVVNTALDSIGSYYLSSDTVAVGARTIGSTYAGSSLLKIDATGTSVSAGLTGTWRLMGFREDASNANRLYVKVS